MEKNLLIGKKFLNFAERQTICRLANILSGVPFIVIAGSSWEIKMNQFGNILRRERKDRKMTLGELAKKLGLSVPYLSQIETGTKPVQETLVERVVRELGLIGDAGNEIRRAAALSLSEYSIRMREGASPDDRVLAASIASGFARLSPERKEELRKIMEDSNRG